MSSMLQPVWFYVSSVYGPGTVRTKRHINQEPVGRTIRDVVRTKEVLLSSSLCIESGRQEVVGRASADARRDKEMSCLESYEEL